MIDAHFHCWQIDQRNCIWPKSDLKSIHRDFLPQDWREQSNDLGIDRAILVQSQENLSDTFWLLELAEQNDFICGVVGWVDLASENVASTLTELSVFKKLKGFRPMLQSMQDDRWILRPEMASGIEKMIELNFSFDALIQPRHLKVIGELAGRYPDLKIIIDHAAKPNIASNNFDSWASDIFFVAQHKNIWIKLSGCATEMSATQNFCDAEKYWDTLAQSFRESKIIWGSDWPVMKLASNTNLTGYKDWFLAVKSWVEASGLASAAIFETNAEAAYNIKHKNNHD